MSVMDGLNRNVTILFATVIITLLPFGTGLPAILARPDVGRVTPISATLTKIFANETTTFLLIEFAPLYGDEIFTYKAGTQTFVDRMPSEITQTELTPGFQYQLRVVPLIGLVRGIPSPSVQVTTTIPGFPRTPEVSSTTTTSVSIRVWPADGYISYYTVEYRIASLSESKYTAGVKFDSEGGRLSYSISQSGLRPGVTYYLRIVPHIRVSNSYTHRLPESDEVQFTLQNLAILKTPLIINTTPVSVLLEFAAANGTVDNYITMYTKDKINFVYGQSIKHSDATNIYRTEQINLDPGVTYDISVVPRVKANEPNVYYSGISTTLQITLPARILPEVVSTTTSSATVKFPAADIKTTSYQCYHSEIGDVEIVHGIIITVVHVQLTYILTQTNLIPGKTYKLWIVPLVVDSDGRHHPGILSNAVQVQIPKPYMIGTPKFFLIDVPKIYMHFFPAVGSTTKYLVQYKFIETHIQEFKTLDVVRDDGRTAKTVYESAVRILSDTEYIFRIVPVVEVNLEDYEGRPSSVVNFGSNGIVIHRPTLSPDEYTNTFQTFPPLPTPFPVWPCPTMKAVQEVTCNECKNETMCPSLGPMIAIPLVCGVVGVIMGAGVICGWIHCRRNKHDEADNDISNKSETQDHNNPSYELPAHNPQDQHTYAAIGLGSVRN